MASRTSTPRTAAPKARRPRNEAHAVTDDAGPLYGVVARTLKDEITSGVHPVGKQLPTETSLCKRFSVSRHTVRDALRMLRDEGLVASRQGSGTVVVPQTAADSFVLEATSINDLVAYSAGMHTEIHATGTELVEGKLASRLGVAGGQPWLVVRGVARSAGKQLPVCWSEYYIHRDYATLGRLLPRHVGPMFLLIEDVFAVNIVEIDQEISLGVVPPALATTLKVKAGATAVEVRRTYKTPNGKIAQISVHTHPATRFRHSMKMRRVRP